MKPIVLIAIVGIAAAALGIGSLNNEIILSVQDLGVGEETLESPIDFAKVAFGIQKVPVSEGADTFKNIIRYCIITNTDDVAIPSGSKIYCKLTDIDGNVAAEGSKVLGTQLGAGVSTQIQINDDELMQAKVQNIHDVILVVQGPKKG
jgi:hypothetical protein